MSPPNPTATKPPSRINLVIGAVVGVGFLFIIGCAVLMAVMVSRRNKPTYGSLDLESLSLTIAPQVQVELLPSHRSLAKVDFEAFAVAPDGKILVAVEGTLFDLIGGAPIVPRSDSQTRDAVRQSDPIADTDWVSGFAFVGDALVVASRNRLGYYTEDGYVDVGSNPVDSAALAPMGNGAGLILYDTGRSIRFADLEDDRPRPALATMLAGGQIQPLTGSPDRITAATGDSIQTLFAVGPDLWRIFQPGRPAPVLELPDEKGDIVGLAMTDGQVYFATKGTIYALGEDVVMPVVIGLGGQLDAADGALFVLDHHTGRIFRISLTAG